MIETVGQQIEWRTLQSSSSKGLLKGNHNEIMLFQPEQLLHAQPLLKVGQAELSPVIRDVLKHKSARPNQVKIHEDELVKISTCPSDEYDYSQIIITYHFSTGILLDRMSKTLEIVVLLTSMIFPLSTSLPVSFLRQKIL